VFPGVSKRLKQKKGLKHRDKEKLEFSLKFQKPDLSPFAPSAQKKSGLCPHLFMSSQKVGMCAADLSAAAPRAKGEGSLW
jgi:hypothetical protein